MKTLSPDTRPEVEALQIAAIRRMSPTERLRRVGDLNRTLDLLAAADVRRRHPNADEIEVRLRVASRRLPAALMRAAFGWDVKTEGY